MLHPAVDTSSGLLHDLIESRFVAIFLGFSTLVTLFLWITWQVHEVGAHVEATRSDGQDA